MCNLIKRLEQIKGGQVQISQHGVIEDELNIKEFNYCERPDDEGNIFLILQDNDNGYERRINEFFIIDIENGEEPIIHTSDNAIQICLIN